MAVMSYDINFHDPELWAQLFGWVVLAYVLWRVAIMAIVAVSVWLGWYGTWLADYLLGHHAEARRTIRELSK